MTHRYALIALLLLATPALADTAAATAERDIRQREQQLNDALSAIDTRTIDRLWADDFVFITPSGRIVNKAQRMAGLKPPDPAAPVLISTLDDLQIRVYGKSAVVIVKTTWRGSIAGKPIADPYIATHVWNHSAAGWRLVAAQVAQVEVKP